MFKMFAHLTFTISIKYEEYNNARSQMRDQVTGIDHGAFKECTFIKGWARLERFRMTLAIILYIFVIIFFSGCHGNDVYFEISFSTILSTNNVTTVGRVFGLTLVPV